LAGDLSTRYASVTASRKALLRRPSLTIPRQFNRHVSAKTRAREHVSAHRAAQEGVKVRTEHRVITIRKQEPLILRGSTPADREARAQHLANLFIGEMVPLLVQVRQDFLDKDRDELIYNCRTFTEYCTRVLRYSESHIRRLIAGHNPASKTFDGSKHRKPELVEDHRTNVERLHDSGFIERCKRYDPVLLGLVIAQAECLDDPDIDVRMQAAGLEGVIVNHIYEEARRREEQEEGRP
jgi:hypothetical protein